MARRTATKTDVADVQDLFVVVDTRRPGSDLDEDVVHAINAGLTPLLKGQRLSIPWAKVEALGFTSAQAFGKALREAGLERVRAYHSEEGVQLARPVE